MTANLAIDLSESNGFNAIATRYSPLYIHSSDHPIMPSIFLMTRGSGQLNSAQKLVDQLRKALEEVQTDLSTAQIRMKTYNDSSRRSESFNVGDEVLLLTKNL